MAIRQLLSRVKELPEAQWPTVPHGDNTAVTKLLYDGEKLSIEYELDNSHLPESISTHARQNWWRKGEAKKEDINLWYRPIDWGLR